MKVYDPTSDRQNKDYEQSDVQHLLRKREWHSYDEMIQWLDQQGDEDRRFTPGEVRRMIDDLSRLRQRRAPFITDPAKLFQELKH